MSGRARPEGVRVEDVRVELLVLRDKIGQVAATLTRSSEPRDTGEALQALAETMTDLGQMMVDWSNNLDDRPFLKKRGRT